ncbi:MAG: efflux RND transporter periplasmic adaptor subunit [Terriglobia bacterium]
MRRPLWIIIIVAGVLVVAAEGYANLRLFHKPVITTPTTLVKQGDIALKVYTTGTLNAQKIARVTAPQVTGGDMTIVKLLPTGSAVKAGDVVVAFDPSAEEFNLQEARAQLAEAQEEIKKAQDDAKAQVAKDRADLITDLYEVEKAEIKVKTNELYSKIDAEQNTLALDQAKRTLAELEADVKSHSTSSQAAVMLAQQDKQKALFTIRKAEQDIKNMTVRSPLSGLVEAGKNYWAAGGIYFTGEQLPDFRIGDEAFSGMGVAQVIDPTAIEIHSSVTETDRADVRVGQPVEIHVDSMPAGTFHGAIASISNSASRGSLFSMAPSTVSTFALAVQFKHAPANLRPGATVHLVIRGTALSNVLYVPPQAVFQVNGNPVVYVKAANGFEAQRVRIKYRTSTQMVVEGVKRGAEVALVNPEEEKSAGAPRAHPGMALPQGGR